MSKNTLLDEELLASAKHTICAEIQALEHFKEGLGDSFVKVVRLILSCQGRVIVTGIGKSGHIGRKMAATFASTGTPSFFVHAAEAVHGDLGMITKDDVLIAISYSGAAVELSTIIPVLKRLGTQVIGVTGNSHSDLARMSDIVLNVHVEREACPLNLAPTSSTTVTLVLGDALAVACLEARDFRESDFARSHPGGALGRRLLTKVDDVMRKGDELPVIKADTGMDQLLQEMSQKRMGMVVVVDDHDSAIGIFTDGDLRRLIEKKGDIRGLVAKDVMNIHPITVPCGLMATEAARLMEEKRLTHMLVVDDKKLVGALHMHDLMLAKVI
ncbi:KpsF/GutQ family sugar-phosphate isomerase [Basilea psittacipulmonis]|uniref:D-arabinose 5-phosphate isomerase n=1 Tax=Basilea psittacipulmonis DSM 24701 TaxID=1072685 RepID=A0A077DG46_9BURK|nr:KpsF/GutQ family sugar-phosphate isomerase [Basilea psittacipulmonis]AIL32128.1 D-arabinose 5-phosphate isomerase [Basilea psittacipulmonis DSM 24701]